jgi:hypothetical protein
VEDGEHPVQAIQAEQAAGPAVDHATGSCIAAPADDVDYYAPLRRRSLDEAVFADVYASELY